MRNWMKAGKRRQLELDELQSAPVIEEAPPQPTERPLVVLLPGMGGFLSFEMHSFADADAAIELLQTRAHAKVQEVNAFWTLQSPPCEAGSPYEAEVLVLTRDRYQPHIVHLISFTELDSAYAFIRAEVIEGLPLESVLVYWSVPISIERDRTGNLRLEPSVCPGSEPAIAEPEEEIEWPPQAVVEPESPVTEPKAWPREPFRPMSMQPVFPPALSGTIGLDFEEPAALDQVAEPQLAPDVSEQLNDIDIEELIQSIMPSAPVEPGPADLMESETGLLPLETADESEPEVAPVAFEPSAPEAIVEPPVAEAVEPPVAEAMVEPIAEATVEPPVAAASVDPIMAETAVEPATEEIAAELFVEDAPAESTVEIAEPIVAEVAVEPATAEIAAELIAEDAVAEVATEAPTDEMAIEAVAEAEVSVEPPLSGAAVESAVADNVLWPYSDLLEEPAAELPVADEPVAFEEPLTFEFEAPEMAVAEEAVAEFLPPELWAAETEVDLEPAVELETAVVEEPEAQLSIADEPIAFEEPPTSEVEAPETAVAEPEDIATDEPESPAVELPELPDIKIGQLPEPPTDIDQPIEIAESLAEAEPIAAEVEEIAPAAELVVEAPEPNEMAPMAPHPIEAEIEDMAIAAQLAAGPAQSVDDHEPVETPDSDLDEVDIEALWERVSSRDPKVEPNFPPRLAEAVLTEGSGEVSTEPSESVESLMGELKRAMKTRRKEAQNSEPFRGFNSPPGRF